jgi:Flp pilus assembly protein protease CpaA
VSGVSATLAQVTATVSEGGVLVGILAVVIGGGACLLGLLRRRRVEVKAAVVKAAVVKAALDKAAPRVAVDEPAHR